MIENKYVIWLLTWLNWSITTINAMLQLLNIYIYRYTDSLLLPLLLLTNSYDQSFNIICNSYMIILRIPLTSNTQHGQNRSYFDKNLPKSEQIIGEIANSRPLTSKNEKEFQREQRRQERNCCLFPICLSIQCYSKESRICNILTTYLTT